MMAPSVTASGPAPDPGITQSPVRESDFIVAISHRGVMPSDRSAAQGVEAPAFELDLAAHSSTRNADPATPAGQNGPRDDAISRDRFRRKQPILRTHPSISLSPTGVSLL